jgi:hypothetical protein
MANVSYKHKDYAEMLPVWMMIDDCLKGEHRIKQQKEQYLPKPNKTDKSPENEARYDAYVQRAVFFEATARTHHGLVGEVFSKDSVYTLPPELATYESNIDGAGTTLDQQSKHALGYALGHGRAGLLADYPPRDAAAGPATKKDLLEGNVRPKVLLYGPRDVINWSTKSYGASLLLNMIVLEEVVESAPDGFEISTEKQYRVLRLSDQQIYFVEIWKENQSTRQFEMTSSFIPVNGAGQPFTHIPFQFIGSEDNTPSVDVPPLKGMAQLNIGHYRNSADYEQSVYLVGQPTAWASGLTQQWIDDNYPKGQFQLGSSAVLMLPREGACGMLQPDPNTMAKEAMEHKERLMVAIGAKLVEQRETQRTATEAGMDEASKTSVLGTAAQNVSFAYQSVLLDAVHFVNASLKEVPFDLNTDFDIAKMSAQDRAQLLSEWQAGGITFEEYRSKLKSGGIAYLDDEEAKDQLENDLMQELKSDPTSPINADPATGLPKMAVKSEKVPPTK